MATSRPISSVVDEICTRLNDPDKIRYGERARTVFLRELRRIITDNKRYKLQQRDFRGLIRTETTKIDDGIILFDSLSRTVDKIIDVFTNSDDTLSQLPFGLVLINEKYPEDHEKMLHNYFYSPQVETSYQRGWYITEEDKIVFYPKDETDGYYVIVKYLSELSIDDYITTTELYIGNGGEFSNKAIDIATDLAVLSINEERNI
jgi:hypothetical protein